MLSAADLAGMQATLEASLPDACAIVRDTLTDSDTGGQIATPATIATVACRVSPAGARDLEQLVERRLEARSTWVATLPRGTSIIETDRIESGGVEYEVLAVLGPRSWELGRRVACRKITPGSV